MIIILKNCDELEKCSFDQSIFLHGDCAIFAIALKDIYGYNIFLLKNEENQIVHFFCIKNENKNEVYCDIRGFSNDIYNFFEEFEDFFDIDSLLDGDIGFHKIKENELKTQIISDLGINFYNKSYNQAVSIIKEEAERWI